MENGFIGTAGSRETGSPPSQRTLKTEILPLEVGSAESFGPVVESPIWTLVIILLREHYLA
jgi:hypothetical protein